MRSLWCILALALTSVARGQDSLVPEAEAMNPPSAARIAALVEGSRTSGWAPAARAASQAAYAAYRADRMNAAQAWNLVDRWTSLFAQTERTLVPGWISTVEASKVSRAEIHIAPSDKPLGELFDVEMQRWL